MVSFWLVIKSWPKLHLRGALCGCVSVVVGEGVYVDECECLCVCGNSYIEVYISVLKKLFTSLLCKLLTNSGVN